jgi:hypothetical protein
MKTNISILIMVLFFSFSGLLFSQVIINDEYFENQWYLDMPGNENTRADIRVLDMWARTMGNSNQKIADIEDDNGAYPNTFHDDLIGRITTQGQGFVGEHATNIAGLLVASQHTIGIAGMNKFAQLRSYVYNSYEQWAERVRDARLDGNKIINISQGTHDRLANVAIQLAENYSSNIVTVVSVGNNSTNISNPAVYPSVIAVGSSTKDNTSSSFSNYGSQIEFLAPGGTDFTTTNPKNIFTTLSDGSYGYVESGTSLAAPLVSGAAGLLLSYKPNLTNEDVKNILINSCDKLEEMNGDNFTNKCGYGRINLKKAAQLVEPPYTLEHGNATLTKLYNNVGISFPSDPILPPGIYYGDPYKLSVDRDDLDYLETPMAWLPKGYSPYNPNTSQEYIVASTTPTSFHAYTYFYYVRHDEVGNPVNIWLPYNPSAHYTVLGKLPPKSVTLNTASCIDGGGGGASYEIDGTTVGSSWSSTAYVGQTIKAIPPSNGIFYQWSDGMTDNPRTVTSDINVNVIYKKHLASSVQVPMSTINQRKIAKDINNNYHLAYESGNKIWHTQSGDGGVNWSAETLISQGGTAVTPSIATTATDWGDMSVFTVWQEQSASGKHLYIRRNPSDLATYTDILTTDNSDMQPVVAASTDGAKVLVVYRGYTNTRLCYYYSSNYRVCKI